MTLTPSTLNAALAHAARRGLLPGAWSSAGAREQLSAGLRRNAVFSARTTNAAYLQEVSSRIARLLQGGYDNDLPQLRLELRQLLAQLQYDPTTGFPGDAELGIPPAEPGSLQDLSSHRRLTLILETQAQLMQGAMRYAEQTTPSRIAQFPAWELVRVETRAQPRGSLTSGSDGWPTRWHTAGGPPITVTDNTERLIAHKSHPVWTRLGDSSLYDDALDVAHPPWAFRSGMGTRQLHHTEATALGIQAPSLPDAQPPRPALPGTSASVQRLTPEIRAQLQAALQASYALSGRLVLPPTPAQP
jgi:hypothetical protein